MIEEILKYAESDTELKRLLENLEDYARVYVLARKRQKGCDGMGEVATLKDEFKSKIDEFITYCKTKGYLVEDVLYDIDPFADEIERMSKG